MTVIAQPGSAFAYSGGGLRDRRGVDERHRKGPLPAEPLPHDREGQAVRGHDANGKELPGGWHVFPEHAAAGLWSTPTDLANLLLLVGRAWRGQSSLFLLPETAREMLKAQNAGPYGLGAAIGDAAGALVVMKRGQNAGYQAYLILLPAEGQGMVVMTNSNHGSVLAEALIRRAAKLYGWAKLDALQD